MDIQQELEQAKKKLEAPQNNIKELERKAKETSCEGWKPGRGEQYYVSHAPENSRCGCAARLRWSEDFVDERNLAFGMAFPTEGQAICHSSWLIARKKVLDAIAQANRENNNWKPDWGNKNKDKSHLIYHHGVIGQLTFINHVEIQAYPAEFYFHLKSFDRIKELAGEETIKTFLLG